MKVVVLAGGLGTRISEESHLKPKPMIEIGDKPVLWHIMKFYSSYGFHDFVICCGYKSYVIKEFFCNYYLHTSDITFDFANNGRMEVHHNTSEPWRVTLVDTGLNTNTAGRVRRVREYLQDGPFLLTYGDGLCNVPLPDLISHHKASGALATITAVEPEGRFGALAMEPDGTVLNFVEKPPGDQAWINGGYMVLEPVVLERIAGDSTSLEGEVLPGLARDGKLSAFRHTGFWQPMDTLREKQRLDALYEKPNPPWKRW